MRTARPIGWLFTRSIGRNGAGRRSAVTQIEPAETADVDFQTSPLRWTHEILIAEFRALREEIVTVKTQVERTYTYLFASGGALLGAIAAAEVDAQVLESYGWALLVGGLVALWFPINHLLMSADMIVAGSYVRDVLAPKLNNLARLAVEERRPAGDDRAAATSTLERMGWSSELADMLPAHIRPYVQGPMSWEEYMPLVRLGTRRRNVLFWPLYIFRTVLLYAPTVILTLAYIIAESPRYPAYVIALLVCIGAVMVWSVAAQIATGRMMGARLRAHRLQAEKMETAGIEPASAVA